MVVHNRALHMAAAASTLMLVVVANILQNKYTIHVFQYLLRYLRSNYTTTLRGRWIPMTIVVHVVVVVVITMSSIIDLLLLLLLLH